MHKENKPFGRILLCVVCILLLCHAAVYADTDMVSRDLTFEDPMDASRADLAPDIQRELTQILVNVEESIFEDITVSETAAAEMPELLENTDGFSDINDTDDTDNTDNTDDIESMTDSMDSEDLMDADDAEEDLEPESEEPVYVVDRNSTLTLESGNIFNRTFYVYCDTPMYPDDGSATIILPHGTAVQLVSANEDIATILAYGKVGTMSVKQLACDKDMCYIIGLPGDYNQEVEERLDELGFLDSTPDMYFDLDTLQAILRFRSLSKLDTSIFIDDTFLNALFLHDALHSSIYNLTLESGDSGEAVMHLEKRLVSKGYLETIPDDYFDGLTMQAVMLYQEVEGLEKTGIADPLTLTLLFSSQARKLPRNLIAVSEETSQYLSGAIRVVDWWSGEMNQLIPVETGRAVVIDLATGLSFQVQRRGGTNHIDAEPLTKADTAVFKEIVNGKWSWNRRAVWVFKDGIRYAASINCMPHGGGFIDNNNFGGHFCIHFLNSRTHGSNRKDPRHQACVKLASMLDYDTLSSIDWDAFYSESGPASYNVDYILNPASSGSQSEVAA